MRELGNRVDGLWDQEREASNVVSGGTATQ